MNHCTEFWFFSDGSSLFLLPNGSLWELVLHLEGPSFLCLWLFQFVTSEVVPALLPDIQGCVLQGTSHLGLAKPSDQSWFGFFFPFGFQYLPKNCSCEVWFSLVAALVGLQGRMSLIHVRWFHGNVGMETGMQPWSWVKTTLLVVSQIQSCLFQSSRCAQAGFLPCWRSWRASPRVGTISAFHGVTHVLFSSSVLLLMPS